MPETSTPPADNPTDDNPTTDGKDSQADPNAGTDNQTAGDSDNLDASKSTDTSDDGDKPTKEEEGDKSPQFDSDIDDWIEKRNLPKPENDEQKQALQDQRNSQRDYSRSQEAKVEAKALEKE